MTKKCISFNKKNKLSTSYKKYKNIKIGTIVCLKNKEKIWSKKYPRKVYAIKGSCFSNDNINLLHGTIGIVIGYKYRKTRHAMFIKPNSKKILINKTKWFQILIENSIYLVIENNVYLHDK